MNRVSPQQFGKRSRWRVLLATVATIVPAAAAAVVTSTPAGASVPAPASGWSSVWSDDFNGAAGTGVNTSNWLYDTGTSYPGGAANWGTGEVETMTSSTANVYQDGNGNLAIKPIRDSSGNWTSGRIETQNNNFAPPAGGVLRVSARIMLPNVSGAGAQGYWPAFWMLGGPFRGNYTNWPSVGEMDTMESVNGQAQTHGTFHCGVAPGGPCNEYNGLGGPDTPSSNPWGNWHTYTIEWDTSTSPQELRWYVDGDSSSGATPYWTVKSTDVDATTWQNATDHGYMIILNVAMGGSWPGSPTSSTVSGAPMLIDYVDVTQKSGGSTGTAVPATSRIQAENYNNQSGTATESCTDSTGCGQDVGWISNGDWLEYDNVDFGSTPLTQFDARVASGAASGVTGNVEVHLDSLSNPSIGSFSIGNTGGWQSWETVPAAISGTTGTHTVYLEFTTGSGQDFVNVNWFTFFTGDTITGPGGKCIDVAGDDTGGSGTAVQIWDCQSYAVDQHWTYVNNTLQTLGLCMQATGGGTANGTKIQLAACDGDGGEQWTTGSNGSLVNPQSGRCLDDPSGSTTNGTQLQIWDCYGNTAQDWTSALFTSSGGGGTGGTSATSTIQAENYNNQYGTQTETCSDTGGGQDVGYISDGDWLEYDNVNFGSTGLTQFQARVASGAASGVSGTVNVVLDNLSNAPIGSFSIGNTGGWQTWETVPANIAGTTGTHTVYLKFATGSGQDFVNVNWFTFS